MALFLTGCGMAETFETVGDDLLQPVMGQIRQIDLDLPESAAAPVMNEDDGGKLYLCDGYVLTVQTLDGGDLNRTVRNLSGFSVEDITILETHTQGIKRYDWVWSAAGEGGDQVGRAVVLDDGSHHYCVTVMADEQTAGSLDDQWTRLFATVALS